MSRANPSATTEPPQTPETGSFHWGKSRPAPNGDAANWHLLPQHSLDVAAVATEMLRRVPALRHVLARGLGLTEDQLVRWTAFWVALHDLGKFAESFQSQCPDVFLRPRGRPPDPARPYTLHHDSLGMLFWKDVLREQVIDEAWFGDSTLDLADGLDYRARASTGHHGQPPTEGGFRGQHFDTREDRAATMAFVDAVRTRFLDADLVAAIAAQEPVAFLRRSQELSWWLAGLTVQADWLGSNTDWFAYQPRPAALGDYWRQACRQAALARHASGVIAPTSAAAMDLQELFAGITTPSPLQQWAAQVPLAAAPQIHLLEDVTGLQRTAAGARPCRLATRAVRQCRPRQGLRLRPAADAAHRLSCQPSSRER